MNISLKNLFINSNYQISPFFILSKFKIHFFLNNFQNFFSTILYFKNFHELKLSKCEFNQILSTSVIFKSNQFENLCNNRLINPNSIIQFSKFCNITSNTNGGAIYYSLINLNIILKFCSFINCTSNGGYGGAFFVSSNCNSIYQSNMCFSYCIATQTHSFRIECSNIICKLFLVTFCAPTQLSLYGSFLLRKTSIISNFNSTNNKIINHGIGIFLYDSNYHNISFGFIDNCIGRGIITMENSGYSNFNYLNVFNNTHQSEGIISIHSTSPNNHFFNSIFKNNYLFNNQFLFGTCYFSNCKFDIAQFNSGTFQISNQFLNSFITTLITKIYFHEKCLDLYLFSISKNKFNLFNFKFLLINLLI